MDDFKDRRLKYIELPKVFQMKASEIDILSKQHLRTCEKLAGQLASRKPKTPDEFEKLEGMKDFVLKSSQLNERTIELIEYLHGVLTEIASDALPLSENAKDYDRLRDQSEAITMITQQRDTLINDLYEFKKAQLRQD